MKQKIQIICNYLDELYPNPRCELNYQKNYELLLAVMLSAQTTDKRVNQVTEILFHKYPSLECLTQADITDLETIIRPIGTFTKKAKNVKEIARRLLEEQNGIVPNDRAYLETLPGVGRKTTNVVLSNLYQADCIAVDTHVSRVSIRLGLAKKEDDVRIIEDKLTKKLPKEQLGKLHHQLVLFGRYHCKARGPECKNCKLYDICKYKEKSKNR
ncbi:MAG: endonuclease III [Firmicutes bacterium]|nr:endonuclease III [Bacillota bacterium]